MSNMMRALVKAKSEPGIWMEEVPVPDIGPNDVLIKVKKSAICGTDVHIYNWDEWARKTVPVPMVTGLSTSSNQLRIQPLDAHFSLLGGSWSLVKPAIRDIADAVAIIGSIDIVLGEVDR